MSLPVNTPFICTSAYTVVHLKNVHHGPSNPSLHSLKKLWAPLMSASILNSTRLCGRRVLRLFPIVCEWNSRVRVYYLFYNKIILKYTIRKTQWRRKCEGEAVYICLPCSRNFVQGAFLFLLWLVLSDSLLGPTNSRCGRGVICMLLPLFMCMSILYGLRYNAIKIIFIRIWSLLVQPATGHKAWDRTLCSQVSLLKSLQSVKNPFS